MAYPPVRSYAPRRGRRARGRGWEGTWGGAGDTAGGSSRPPRPAPAARLPAEPFTCRGAPSSMAPLRPLGPSSPPVRFRKPWPFRGDFQNLKLPGKRRRSRGIGRPLPRSAGPPGTWSQRRTRLRQSGSRDSTPAPEATAPPPGPTFRGI